MSVVLDVRALSFGHHGRALGAPVDLQVARGEMLCLLGPNGCGKTTLFRTVLGLIPSLGGHVEIAGHDVATTGREALARCVAYVPQAHAGVFPYLAEDVVLMGRAARVGTFAAPSRHDRAVALECLQRLGVAHLRDRPYTEISGGERQLVLIARALAQEAPLIVMDEPTASLDFGNQLAVLREIESLTAQGIAVLMSTHQPQHALRVADRVALMKAGRLIETGVTRSVMTVRSLAELYALDAAEIEHSIPWGARG